MDDSPTPARRRRRAPQVVLVLAGLAQGGVLLLTFVMGVIWVSGPATAAGYVTALILALLLGGVAFVLVRRASWLVLAVPMVCAALTVGLFVVSVDAEGDASCTPDLRGAAAQLRPLPGSSVDLHGEPFVTEGCISRFPVRRSDADRVLAHYRRELTRQGWAITDEHLAELDATKGRVLIEIMPPEVEGAPAIMVVEHIS